MQQGNDPGLTCTSSEGAVIHCSLTQADGSKAASVQCSTPGSTVVTLTADGQVITRHMPAAVICIRCLPILYHFPSVCAWHLKRATLQVIMVPAESPPPALPSGRGVSTHGAPLSDGNMDAKIKDSSPTWRSVLNSGEVAQAYK